MNASPDKDAYGHPFTPYDVQVQFMDALYETLCTKRVGIFESPTGTGKTLSLLGPAVAWIRSLAFQQLQNDLNALDSSGGPEWSVKRAKELRREAFEDQRRKHLELVEAAKREVQAAKPISTPAKRARLMHHSKPAASTGVDAFVLEEPPLPGVAHALALWNNHSSASAGTGADVSLHNDESAEALAPLLQPRKVFFASRTHSQLAQVADALASLRLHEPVRYVALGSRRQLCINPEVTRLASVNQMNEKCADLQKHSKCEFRHNTTPLRNQMLGEIMDIEDLAKFGKASSSCPYYSVREALPYAEVVALPYPLLLVDRNRRALGLDVSGSAVIIDEAHNLVDTITSLNSSQIDEATVLQSLKGLRAYMARVGGRLSPTNVRKVTQIIKLVESVAFYFADLPKPVKPGTRVSVSDLFARGNADTLNVLELSEFVQTSKLVYKVESYIQYVTESAHPEALKPMRAASPAAPSPKAQIRGSPAAAPVPAAATVPAAPVSVNALGTLMDFLALASDPLSEGKLFLDAAEPDSPSSVSALPRAKLQYLLLDPSPAFKSVMSDAKSVVLAGGTMEPVTDFTQHLLPYIRAEECSINSYGHIVPKSQLMVMPLSSLQFTFAKRGSPSVIAELGLLVLEICANVPHGVVVFFPGYSYLSQVIKAWQKSGLLAKLEKAKRLYWETNDAARRDPDLFSKYSRAANATKESGAALLAVVGGRLSEGINFSDNLARAVVMIGLPFPNAFSAEMVAKRAYIESKARAAGRSADDAKKEAREYYENIAMRAVNQSVGRAIRHIRDYAAIYLVDERFKQTSVRKKLSTWVRDSIVPEGEALVPTTRRFFHQNHKAFEN